ncbi:MAG: MerR family transcriptional regulator [Anaerolineales bacterium]|nr:MerR family transcriptional regulator [Anaerolineales bacterium]
MESMSIGEVAQMAGLETSTLRYYESIGLLPAPERVSGRRRYDREVLTQLRVIKVAKQAGFTLAEITTLMGGFSEIDPPSRRWKEMAQGKIEEIDAIIARAEGMKRILMEGLECDCLRYDTCEVLLRTDRPARNRPAAPMDHSLP